MRLGLLLAVLSAPALAGPPVRWCVGETCAASFAGLPPWAVGELVAVDAVGNAAPQGRFCSWRSTRVAAVVELTQQACDEARRRLDDAAAALAWAGLVPADEWSRVTAAALRGVLLYPARVLEGLPRGEELVAGVYVPATGVVHLGTTLEAAPHELLHAALRARGEVDRLDTGDGRVDGLTRAWRSKYSRRPVL